jgi:hypothetical protein
MVNITYLIITIDIIAINIHIITVGTYINIIINISIIRIDVRIIGKQINHFWFLFLIAIWIISLRRYNFLISTILIFTYYFIFYLWYLYKLFRFIYLCFFHIWNYVCFYILLFIFYDIYGMIVRDLLYSFYAWCF